MLYKLQINSTYFQLDCTLLINDEILNGRDILVKKTSSKIS
jgi:hypothetical protein